jgi:hypothetical protein
MIFLICWQHSTEIFRSTNMLIDFIHNSGIWIKWKTWENMKFIFYHKGGNWWSHTHLTFLLLQFSFFCLLQFQADEILNFVSAILCALLYTLDRYVQVLRDSSIHCNNLVLHYYLYFHTFFANNDHVYVDIIY